MPVIYPAAWDTALARETLLVYRDYLCRITVVCGAPSYVVPASSEVRGCKAAWASHQAIYVLPDGRLTGCSFLSIDAPVSFSKHLLRGGGVSSLPVPLPASLRCHRRWLSFLHIVERHIPLLASHCANPIALL
jgi:hypothetical protein